MSTPTTPIRSMNAAQAIIEAAKDKMSPTDLAVALCTELGLGSDQASHQVKLKAFAHFFAQLDDELCGLSDAMDEVRFDQQDKRWGEGGATPESGGSNQNAALPRMMGNPVAQLEAIIASAFPDRDSILDTIENELATEDAANDMPLALIGNRGYESTVSKDSRYPRI